MTLDTLAPGVYQDIQLEEVTLSDLNQDIYAIVDAENQLSECNEDNNSVSTLVGAGTITLIGEINVTTDSEEYGPNTPVAIEYTVTNLGTLPADFQVELRIEDSNGETVETLDVPTLDTLAGGETLILNANWNTGFTLAGLYQAHALLFSAEGDFLTEATQPFTITAAETGLLNLRTTVDKPIYHTTDTVQIDNMIRNLSVNTPISGAKLQILIQDSTTQEVFNQEIALEELVPGTVREVSLSFAFTDATEGTYTVQTQILTPGGHPLANDSATYQVQLNPNFSLIGAVATQSPSLHQGETQICTDTITNNGTLNFENQAIRQILVAVDNGQKINETEHNINIEAGTSQTLERTIATDEQAPGDYACILQAKLNEQWKTLGSATFKVQKSLSSLVGTVAVQMPNLHIGDTQVCTDTLTNDGAQTLSAINIRQLRIAIDTELEISRTELTLDIETGTHQILERTLVTSDLEIGGSACVLQAELGGQWQTLGTAEFQLQEPPLEAFVEVQFPSLYVGEIQTCTDTIINHEVGNFTDQPFRQSLVASESGIEVSVTELSLTIELGTCQVLERTIETEGLEIGEYACVLSIELGGEWKTFAQAEFQVDEPPIQIESNLTVGERGRVLILLDNDHPNDDDPHGPNAAPTLTAQRAFLENLLEQEGWTYTIVTNDDAFTNELRSGGYTVYALFAEQEKLDTQVQEELREAIFRGEGLVVAGAHDDRHQHLNDALGIKFEGKLSNVQNLSLHDSPLHEASEASLAFE